MGEEFATYKGYCVVEHALESGQFVRVSKTSEFKITYILGHEQNHVTHLILSEVEVTDLKTGLVVAKHKPESGKISLVRLTSLSSNEEGLYGGVWHVGDRESLELEMAESVDYQIRIVVTEMDSSKKLATRECEVLLKRDFKQVNREILKQAQNWTLGAADLLTQEGTELVCIRDSIYDPKLEKIISLRWYGRLRLTGGELVFAESPVKREAFYTETVDEKHEWQDGELVRVWKQEKRPVDHSPYAYDAIRVQP